jgi:hypothetical protein
MYAASSNGSIIFNADVTLNSGATAAIIAANTVTINNGVTVTIGGSVAAQVYANVRNYDVASGGSGGLYGSFGGAGATSQAFDPNNPPVVAAAGTAGLPSVTSGALTASSQPKSTLVAAASSSSLRTNVKSIASRALTTPSTSRQVALIKPVLKVANSAELLAQLESATESNGKVTVTAKTQTRNRVQTSTRLGNVVQKGNVPTTVASNPTNTAITPKSAMTAVTPINNPVGPSATTRSY